MEETSILKELTTGIRKLLSERLVSPLFPAFILSWLVVNYRLVVTIFSDEFVEDKFAFIDTTLYPNWHYTLMRGLLIPLSTALAYIYAYPYPARWVFRFALKRQQELREARQQVEKATLLSEEDSQKLRTYYYNREKDYQKQLEERQELIEQLRAKIDELQKASSSVDPQAESKPQTHDETSNYLADLSGVEERVIVILGGLENKGQLNVSETDIIRVSNESATDIRMALEILEKKKYVKKQFVRGDWEYSLLLKGRVAYKEIEPAE